ncbi:MAG: hypothetical protein OFPII_42860 [Osedax symbiont Rs1]|nr:MAG: hypothetical protein OFPII_42860 [Osedax symbiont Rs1]
MRGDNEDDHSAAIENQIAEKGRFLTGPNTLLSCRAKH